MRIVKRFRNTLKWKLIAVLSALIVGVVSTIGAVSYLQTSRTIKRDIEKQSNQILKQANLNLERYVKSYTQGFLMISFSPELQEWLQVEEGKYLDSFKLFQKIKVNYGQSFFFQHPEILSITLYNGNGNEMRTAFTTGFNKDYKFSTADLEEYENEEAFIVDVMYSRNYVDTNGNELHIPVLTMLKKIRYGKNTGFLKIDVDLNPAFKIVNELGIGDTGYGLIVDQNGRVLMHPNQAVITRQLANDLWEPIQSGAEGSFFRKGTNEFVIYGSIQSSAWKTVVVVPYREFARSIYIIREITVAAALLALVLAIIAAVGISSSFTSRIAKLRRSMRKTGRGKFDVRVDIAGTDEVAELGAAYNAMLEDLEFTVNELAESKLIQQKAVMSALQSQIDSHFLYNTLESINSLANLAGQPQIEQATIALSKMLRYTSDYKSTVVTLNEEVRHLINYLNIMKIRLGDDLEYDLRFDPERGEAYGLKAVMQPIVENCIKHADVMDVPLRIGISVGTVTMGDAPYMMLRVTDNGKGFKQEQLEWIDAEIRKINVSPLHRQRSNIGLLNIHFRLKMHYQEDPYAGMTLYNAENGGGAVVEIVFPMQIHAKQEVIPDAL
ncbi:sensor histidine kinase [Paenibacillus sp. MBLB4367]|uniref:sensor histidine kinase n=1 Tax=Paenibacillus sp. MBLB4367 TaxID=3384767 RepID=UPI0039081638